MATLWARISSGDSTLLGRIDENTLLVLEELAGDKLPLLTKLEFTALVHVEPGEKEAKVRYSPVDAKGSTGTLYIRTDSIRTITPVKSDGPGPRNVEAHYNDSGIHLLRTNG